LWQIIFTNVGNPHALGQKPLTFPRQVSVQQSTCSFPPPGWMCCFSELC
jgi:hypothetical protein